MRQKQRQGRAARPRQRRRSRSENEAQKRWPHRLNPVILRPSSCPLVLPANAKSARAAEPRWDRACHGEDQAEDTRKKKQNTNKPQAVVEAACKAQPNDHITVGRCKTQPTNSPVVGKAECFRTLPRCPALPLLLCPLFALPLRGSSSVQCLVAVPASSDHQHC